MVYLRDKAPEVRLVGQKIIEFVIWIAFPPVSSIRLYEVVDFHQCCIRESNTPYIDIVQILQFFLKFVRNSISV